MLRINFTTNTAAFDEPNRKSEVSKVLRSTAVKVAAGLTEGQVLDVNGNNIGTWTLTTDN